MDKETKLLGENVIQTLCEIYDPEIPVNIYELGLIYDIKIDEGDVEVIMTLTSPFCPVAGSLPKEVAARVSEVEGVKKANVELVFEPPWTMDLMSNEAKLELNMTDSFTI